MSFTSTSIPCRTFVAKIIAKLIPKNVKEVMKSEKWKNAMDEEIRALDH